MHVIKAIISRRKALGLTQETLAEMSGIGLRTLKQLEGTDSNPTLETLEKVADVLGMELTLQIKTIVALK